MTQVPKLLRQILIRIEELKASSRDSLVVFDLDSTLFDVSPRLQRILLDFANAPENQKRFPESVKIMQEITTLRTDWGIKNALVRAGLDDHHPEFHQELKNFWMEKFFSNEYLAYDLPYDGAVDYVRAVHNAGAQVAYLTGRDVARMQKGSIETLKKWNFPLGSRAELILKPNAGMDDAQFKSDWFAAIPTGQFGATWFFENEPVNVNLVRDIHDHVEIVFFDSTHSGKQAPHPDLQRIMHYILED